MQVNERSASSYSRAMRRYGIMYTPSNSDKLMKLIAVLGDALKTSTGHTVIKMTDDGWGTS